MTNAKWARPSEDCQPPRESIADPYAVRRGEISTNSSDLRTLPFIVTIISLAILSYPSLLIIAPQFASTLFICATIVLIPLVATRLDEITWPALWLLGLTAVYLISSMSESDSSQGYKHTVTLVCFGVVFLTFAAYGSEMLENQWSRWCIHLVLIVDAVAVTSSNFPKNTTGSALVYLSAVAAVIYLRRSRSGLKVTVAFTLLIVLIGLYLNVRFLILCALVFSLAYFGARMMSWRRFWVAGVVGCAASISAVIWFFLNVDRGGVAQELGRRITEISGHRANSGRDQLYFYLLSKVQDNPLTGLGAGTLPRDFLSTEFSAHNFYLQVYLQVGLLGVAVLICFLLSVWRDMAQLTTVPGRFGGAVFLMFVIHNGAEVLLLQNSALVAIPAWAAIGLALALDRSSSSTRGAFCTSLTRRDDVDLPSSVHLAGTKTDTGLPLGSRSATTNLIAGQWRLPKSPLSQQGE